MLYLVVDNQNGEASKKAVEALRQKYGEGEHAIDIKNATVHGLVSLERLAEIEREQFTTSIDENRLRVTYRYAERIRKTHRMINQSNKIFSLAQNGEEIIRNATNYQGEIEYVNPSRL